MMFDAMIDCWRDDRWGGGRLQATFRYHLVSGTILIAAAPSGMHAMRWLQLRLDLDSTSTRLIRPVAETQRRSFG